MAIFDVNTVGKEVVAELGARLDGKTIVVTGPSQKSLAAQLVVDIAGGCRPAKIILAGRSEAKIVPVIENIHSASVNNPIDVTFVQLDLAYNASVRTAAKTIKSLTTTVDVLVNCAGVMGLRTFTNSSDGVEGHFAANHLGHFLLTNLLIDGLAAGKGGLVLNVTSMAYVLAEVNTVDPNFDEGRLYDPWVAYGRSKAANILFSHSVSEKYKARGVISVAVDPGMIFDTKLQENSGVDHDFMLKGFELATERNNGEAPPHEPPVSLEQGSGALLVGVLGDYAGPVVRTAPNELSFNTAQAWRDIYDFRPGHLTFVKSEFYEGGSFADQCGSIVSERSATVHGRMRKHLSHAFSQRSLVEQEELIASTVDKLIDRVGELGTAPEGVDIVKWWNMMTFDIIGDLAFGETFGGLQSGKVHIWIERITGAMTQGALADCFKRFPTLAKIVLTLFPGAIKKAIEDTKINERYSIELVRKRIERETNRKDFLTRILEQRDPKETSDVQIAAHASDFVLAGSETTATALSTIVYYLLHTPDAMAILKCEIMSSFKTYAEISAASTNNLKYLRAVILEGMRMYPPLPFALPRVVPEGGDIVDGHYVPAGTTVSVNPVAACYDARNFKDPEVFEPERWTKSNSDDDLEASQPFSMGPRGCIGRNLAWMEMRTSLVKLLFRYKLELVDHDVDWLRDSRGSSGIGLATAEILASRGAQVHILDINAPDEHACKPRFFNFISCDIASWQDLKSAFSRIGHVDLVFANAGVSEVTNYFHDTLDSNGDLVEPDMRLFDVNFRAVLNVVKLAWRAMKQQGTPGSIVITTSATAYAPEQSLPTYSSLKLALVGLIRSLRSTIIRDNITINGVAPAATITKLLPRHLATPIIAAGLPVSEAHFVGLALAFAATAKEQRKVEPYGKDQDTDIEAEGRWNGRIILTLGDTYTELEEPIATLRPQWFGTENTRLTRLQQAVTDFREPKTVKLVRYTGQNKLDPSLAAALPSPPDWLNSFPGYSCITLITLLSIITYGTRKRQRYGPAPIAGLKQGESIKAARQRFRTDAQQMLLDGYAQNKNKPFYVPSPLGERLMIPPKYVEELKTAPVDEVDFVATFFEMFEKKYTMMGSRSTMHPRTAKGPLNQYMDLVLEPLYEEIVQAFNECLPQTKEWASYPIADKLIEIVARASSRMFGGESLSKNSEWLNTTMNFAMDGFVGAQKIKAYPKFVRPVVAPFIKELKRMPHHYNVASKTVVPILEARERMKPEQKPSDFIQWMADDAKGAEENDKQFLASIQLKIMFAALHTSAAAPAQLIFDLCHMPEYIEPLRQEIEDVLRDYSGVPSKPALMKMYKLDSFMKESQRQNPLLLTTFERVITRDYKMSDGFIIPKGTTIGVPAQAIAMDPNLFVNPTNFDGFRFSNIRATANNAQTAGRAQWAASNLESMAFGYGRHACPGRFFAGHEIKQIMIYLLMNYDFRFVEGTKGRPENVRVETQLIPNHETKIEMRTRRK
ncbi:cytochrome P450 [Paraphaeosphaeria sporulosa]